MLYNPRTMLRPTTRVAAVQFATLLVFSGIIWLAWEKKSAVSFAFGGAVALFTTLLVLLRERQSERHPEWDARHQLVQFFRLAIERYLLAGGLLALGLLSGKAIPQALLIGFVSGQLGWLATSVMNKRQT